MTVCQLDLSPLATTLWAQLFCQFYPAKGVSVQAMSSQFLQENALGNSVKKLAEVQVDHIHILSSSPEHDTLTKSLQKGIVATFSNQESILNAPVITCDFFSSDSFQNKTKVTLL